jgi:hypothetical protein
MVFMAVAKNPKCKADYTYTIFHFKGITKTAAVVMISRHMIKA